MKRKAETQLTKDDLLGYDDKVSKVQKGIEVASSEEMKGRKVRRVKRRGKRDPVNMANGGSFGQAAGFSIPSGSEGELNGGFKVGNGEASEKSDAAAGFKFDFGTAAGDSSEKVNTGFTFDFGNGDSSGKTESTAGGFTFDFGKEGSSEKTETTAGGFTFNFGTEGDKKLVKQDEDKKLGNKTTGFTFDFNAEKPENKVGVTDATLPKGNDATNGKDKSEKKSEGFNFSFDGKNDFDWAKSSFSGLANESFNKDNSSWTEGKDQTPKTTEPNDEKVELSGAVSSGEEGETTIVDLRAKVFELHESEWKEKGVCNFKLNKNTSSGNMRIICRAEKSYRLVLNTPVAKGMKTSTQSSNHSVILTGLTNYLDEAEKNKTVLISFKTDADLEQLMSKLR